MTVPLWVLLGFAAWTLMVPLTGVGVHRWGSVLSRKAELTDFPGGVVQGAPFYCRAMRAHANCVENLPVFAAIAIMAAIAGIDTPRLDQLAIVFLAARVGQTLTHMLFPETNLTIGIRFSFFAVQIFAMLWMITIIVFTAWPPSGT
ncbi:MAG: MAPEG family protein [Hyphomicrobiales bacterium]